MQGQQTVRLHQPQLLQQLLQWHYYLLKLDAKKKKTKISRTGYQILDKIFTNKPNSDQN
jgi:hypothetical protein